jgi:mRNA interferase HicA
MKARELIKLIENAGWIFVRQDGSHKIFEKPGERRPLVVPDHGSKDLKKGLMFAILKQAGLR